MDIEDWYFDNSNDIIELFKIAESYLQAQEIIKVANSSNEQEWINQKDDILERSKAIYNLLEQNVPDTLKKNMTASYPEMINLLCEADVFKKPQE